VGAASLPPIACRCATARAPSLPRRPRTPLHHSIAAALVSFGGGASDSGSAAADAGSKLVLVIALILLPVAIAMNGYAIFVFIWRSQMIARKRPSHFDDRVGPLGLCAAVVTALAAIFLVSLIDFFDFMSGPEPAPGPGPSPAPAAGLAANAVAGLLNLAAAGPAAGAAAAGGLPAAA
jgi:hypothetical protein